ncbi:MAG: hypothetical protein HRT88_08735 [Lentisphaeraceae bacterium]|nr:hypothetical protein [Lentisphaeraceae bacterium]
MRLLLISFLCLAVSLSAASPQQKLNAAKLELAHERLRVIKADEDLNLAHQRLMRKHRALAEALAKNPKLKNSKLKEPQLTQLKVKLLREDEELREFREVILKMHRKLEDELLKKKSIVVLMEKVEALGKK